MVVLVPVPGVVTAPGVLVSVQFPMDGKPLSVTLPVAKLQLGEMMVSIAGAVGVAGCVLITTLTVAPELHPAEFATEKVYEPAASPVTVLLVPVPIMVVVTGVLVKVHEPVDGRPLSVTLPVPTVHVGCTIVPTLGTVGVAGCAGITTLEDDAVDIHPSELVTLYV